MSEEIVEPTAAPAEATPAPKRRNQRLTDAQKTEGETLYRAGTHTAEELAAKIGGTLATWRKHFLKKKIKKGENKAVVESKRAAVVEQALTLDPAVHARRVFDTKNETYRVAEMLRKLTVKAIVECTQAGKPLGTIQNDIKAIREAAAVIKTVREEQFAVLGIKLDEASDEALPELIISGLDEEQIADLQQAAGVDELENLAGLEEDDNDVVSIG